MGFVYIDGGVTAPPGFTASGIHCGIRKNGDKRDLALIMADRECAAAAVYTTNKVKAAPVWLTMGHLKNGRAHGIIANSGNANACTAGSMEAAKEMVAAIAAETGLKSEDFIVNSTGVIGQPLPVRAIVSGVPELVNHLSTDTLPAAEGIMTTDTFPKYAAVTFEMDSKQITIGGIAKGSGMIHPNMATMLAFVTTDCAIEPKLLQEALKESVDSTYNCISVDGDTSTNDMTAILASGTAGNQNITEKSEDYKQFVEALTAVNLQLAKAIAQDGEGATKLITCQVTGAKTDADARCMAKSVIASSLVKAAMFGSDANWGRVLCAMGYSGSDFEPTNVDISFSSIVGQIAVCKKGEGLVFDEDQAKDILSQKEVAIEVNITEGKGMGVAYGCDLTYDYVKINGDYRT